MTRHRQTKERRIGRAAAGTLGLLAIGLSYATATSPQDDEKVSVEIEAARSAQEQWVELKTQISKEKATLAEKKLFLRDQIDLVRSQIESTRAEVDETRASIASTTEKRDELEAENEQLRAAQESLEARIGDLEQEVLALVKRFPAKLAEDVRAYTQQFPADPSDTKMTLSQRFTLAVAVLQAADKFNTQVHVLNERRDLTNGQSAQVSTLYLGISEGFFVDGTGLYAGRGLPTAEGFQWTPTDADAPGIQQAVLVHGGDPAVYTPIPVVVRDEANEGGEE